MRDKALSMPVRADAGTRSGLRNVGSGRPLKPRQNSRAHGGGMSSQTLADLIVSFLKIADVHRVHGVLGDSLNGIIDATWRDGSITWVHLRHEEAAAVAACG